ncbi:MAG: hypothetical protein HYY96_12740 [Candidatus Tectomicrobia bacterium]|nr:hypothetical protein [Candidatus Tectomicrobia bacterium]
MNYARAFRLVMGLVSLHSLVLGLLLYFFTAPVLQAFGFQQGPSLFYPRQSGVFLFILGIAYLLPAVDLRRFRAFAWFTVVSKLCAVLFLYGEVLVFRASRIVLLAGIGDTLMGLVILLLCLQTRGEWQASATSCGEAPR